MKSGEKNLIELVLQIRAEVKANKNWAKADMIRKRLNDMGIIVTDKKDKPSTWAIDSDKVKSKLKLDLSEIAYIHTVEEFLYEFSKYVYNYRWSNRSPCGLDGICKKSGRHYTPFEVVFHERYGFDSRLGIWETCKQIGLNHEIASKLVQVSFLSPANECNLPWHNLETLELRRCLDILCEIDWWHYHSLVRLCRHFWYHTKEWWIYNVKHRKYGRRAF